MKPKGCFIHPERFALRLACPWCNDGTGQWEGMDESFGFYSDILKQAVHPPLGFSTDTASVPKAPVVFTMFGGRYAMSAYIHDYLTRYRRFKREKCDTVFLEAMRCENLMELGAMAAAGSDLEAVEERARELEGRATAMYAGVALYTATGLWKGPWDEPGYDPVA
jgi:hypothetical protein